MHYLILIKNHQIDVLRVSAPMLLVFSVFLLALVAVAGTPVGARQVAVFGLSGAASGIESLIKSGEVELVGAGTAGILVLQPMGDAVVDAAFVDRLYDAGARLIFDPAIAVGCLPSG